MNEIALFILDDVFVGHNLEFVVLYFFFFTGNSLAKSIYACLFSCSEFISIVTRRYVSRRY